MGGLEQFPARKVTRVKYFAVSERCQYAVHWIKSTTTCWVGGYPSDSVIQVNQPVLVTSHFQYIFGRFAFSFHSVLSI